MNIKKYQVFISSTCKDLIIERKKALEAVLLAECIPCGMESFFATDQKQFDVIKKVIDLCDYYILIIGGKYGTIAEGSELSYTELEYQYALSKKIPVLAFVKENIDDLADERKENSETLKKKLESFKEKVMQGRMVSKWNSAEELCTQIAVSLLNAKTQFSMPGWTRGSDFDDKKLLSEIYDLKKENEELRKNVRSSSASSNSYENIKFPMHYEETLYVFSRTPGKKDIEPTLGSLFKHISTHITSERDIEDFNEAVDSFVSGYHVSSNTHEKLKAQFIIYNLISERSETDKKGYVRVRVSLTEYGKKEMIRLNSVIS